MVKGRSGFKERLLKRWKVTFRPKIYLHIFHQQSTDVGATGRDQRGVSKAGTAANTLNTPMLGAYKLMIRSQSFMYH